MANLEKIRNVLVPIAAEYDIVVNDVLWRHEHNQKILEVPIMFADKTMDLETCNVMGELFSTALDNIEDLDFEYFLDVCSPGAERLLNSFEEIAAELNNYVYVKLKDPKAGFFEIYGDLIKVDKDKLTVAYMDKTRQKEFEISLDNISLIRLAIKF